MHLCVCLYVWGGRVCVCRLCASAVWKENIAADDSELVYPWTQRHTEGGRRIHKELELQHRKTRKHLWGVDPGGVQGVRKVLEQAKKPQLNIASLNKSEKKIRPVWLTGKRSRSKFRRMRAPTLQPVLVSFTHANYICQQYSARRPKKVTDVTKRWWILCFKHNKSIELPKN